MYIFFLSLSLYIHIHIYIYTHMYTHTFHYRRTVIKEAAPWTPWPGGPDQQSCNVYIILLQCFISLVMFFYGLFSKHILSKSAHIFI